VIGGPCRRCGVEHDHTRVRIGGHVIVSNHGELAGAIGVVHSWTVYGTPLSVRVTFAPGVLDPNEPSMRRESFDPCELLYVRQPAEAASRKGEP
jgi:hypothetical protein